MLRTPNKKVSDSCQKFLLKDNNTGVEIEFIFEKTCQKLKACLPEHDRVFHIFTNRMMMANKCDKSPVNLKIFILTSGNYTLNNKWKKIKFERRFRFQWRGRRNWWLAHTWLFALALPLALLQRCYSASLLCRRLTCSTLLLDLITLFVYSGVVNYLAGYCFKFTLLIWKKSL